MEGMEHVSQPRHETAVVIDHAEEALEAGLVGWNGEVTHCLDSGLQGEDA